MKHCCRNCFSDDFISAVIVGERMVGKCDYCKRKGQNVIAIKKLTKYFETFFEIYELEQEGVHYYTNIPHGSIFELDEPEDIVLTECYPLHILIQEDWGIFNDTNYESLNEEILFDILYDIQVPFLNKPYTPSLRFARFYENQMYYEDKKDIWSRFSNEIKNENRFFIKTSLQEEIIELIKTKEIIKNQGKLFFRARIGHNIDSNGVFAYDKEIMGMPPARLASNGRANPRGITYLYTASDSNTAISEVRPWKGAYVSVAELTPISDLKIIDLTLSAVSSPFYYMNLKRDIELERLLEELSLEFSKPVSPFDGDIDYLPTQYIAELIKVEGFDGFKFKSSLANGYNYVFFKEGMFEFIETSLHLVNNVLLEQDKISGSMIKK
jgi:hypothetical protein